MEKPNITEALEWILSEDDNCIIKASHGPLIASSMGDDNSAYYASEDEAIANAQAISAVPEMIDALMEAHKAIKLLPDDSLGFGNLTDARGEERFYPLKEELRQNVESALKKAGVKL